MGSIDERADGVYVSYDLMASFLAPYGNAQASDVARQLDEKVLALLTGCRSVTAICRRSGWKISE